MKKGLIIYFQSLPATTQPHLLKKDRKCTLDYFSLFLALDMKALINREQWDNNQLHPQDFPGSLMKRLEIQHSVQLQFLGHSSPITPLSQSITFTLGSPPNTAKELPEVERAQTHILAARMSKSQFCQYPGRQVLITTFCLTTVSHRCFHISNSASKSVPCEPIMY